jgi:hypothetical protein
MSRAFMYLLAVGAGFVLALWWVDRKGRPQA